MILTVAPEGSDSAGILPWINPMVVRIVAAIPMASTKDMMKQL